MDNSPAFWEFSRITAERLGVSSNSRLGGIADEYCFLLAGGPAEFLFGSRRIMLNRSEILVLSPDETAKFVAGEPLLCFRVRTRERTWKRNVPILRFRFGHPIFGAATRLEELLLKTDEHSRQLTWLLSREFLLHLLEPEESGRSDKRFEQMLEYLGDRLLLHPTRQGLAKQFNLSPQQVNSIFRQKLGISPNEYVQGELIKRAIQLLKEENLSVKETAARLGFSNPFYFSRIFKKVTGNSPSSLC